MRANGQLVAEMRHLQAQPDLHDAQADGSTPSTSMRGRRNRARPQEGDGSRRSDDDARWTVRTRGGGLIPVRSAGARPRAGARLLGAGSAPPRRRRPERPAVSTRTLALHPHAQRAMPGGQRQLRPAAEGILTRRSSSDVVGEYREAAAGRRSCQTSTRKRSRSRALVHRDADAWNVRVAGWMRAGRAETPLTTRVRSAVEASGRARTMARATARERRSSPYSKIRAPESCCPQRFTTSAVERGVRFHAHSSGPSKRS